MKRVASNGLNNFNFQFSFFNLPREEVPVFVPVLLGLVAVIDLVVEEEHVEETCLLIAGGTAQGKAPFCFEGDYRQFGSDRLRIFAN